MAHFKTGLTRRYLSVEDLTEPIEATIKSVALEEVGFDERKEKKWVVHFEPYQSKALILNVTRCEAIAAIAGTPDVDRWAGVTIRLSRGQTNYRGKRIGCVEVSAPSGAPAPRTAMPPRDPDDAMPF